MKVQAKRELPSGETILEQLNWRYATKMFDPDRRIPDEEWGVLERSLVLAPSSYGLQPYKFVVVTDEKLKEELRPACYGQPQITESSHLVVFAARKKLDDEYVEKYVARVREVRGTPREKMEESIKSMKNKMKSLTENGNAVSWSQRQAYIALGFLLETAALRGIDACPMEGFEPEKVDRILGLEDYTASALCTLGYRSGGDWLAPLEKVRFPEEELIDRR